MVRPKPTGEKAKRVTIMIANDLDKKIRLRQAKMIQQDQKTHSFSSVINDILRQNLR